MCTQVKRDDTVAANCCPPSTSKGGLNICLSLLSICTGENDDWSEQMHIVMPHPMYEKMS